MCLEGKRQRPWAGQAPQATSSRPSRSPGCLDPASKTCQLRSGRCPVLLPAPMSPGLLPRTVPWAPWPSHPHLTDPAHRGLPSRPPHGWTDGWTRARTPSREMHGALPPQDPPFASGRCPPRTGAQGSVSASPPQASSRGRCYHLPAWGGPAGPGSFSSWSLPRSGPTLRQQMALSPGRGVREQTEQVWWPQGFPTPRARGLPHGAARHPRARPSRHNPVPPVGRGDLQQGAAPLHASRALSASQVPPWGCAAQTPGLSRSRAAQSPAGRQRSPGQQLPLSLLSQ